MAHVYIRNNRRHDIILNVAGTVVTVPAGAQGPAGFAPGFKRVDSSLIEEAMKNIVIRAYFDEGYLAVEETPEQREAAEQAARAAAEDAARKQAAEKAAADAAAKAAKEKAEAEAAEQAAKEAAERAAREQEEAEAAERAAEQAADAVGDETPAAPTKGGKKK